MTQKVVEEKSQDLHGEEWKCKEAQQKWTEAQRKGRFAEQLHNRIKAIMGLCLNPSWQGVSPIVAIVEFFAAIGIWFYFSPTVYIVADFDNCSDCYVVNDNRPNNMLDVDYSCPDQKDNCAVRLKYQITEWSALLIRLGDIDLISFSKLTFDIKTDLPQTDAIKMKLVLKHADNTEAWIYISGITNKWQKISVNLSDPDFEPEPLSSLTKMSELVFTFEADNSGPAGVVYLDNIAFER